MKSSVRTQTLIAAPRNMLTWNSGPRAQSNTWRFALFPPFSQILILLLHPLARGLPPSTGNSTLALHVLQRPLTPAESRPQHRISLQARHATACSKLPGSTALHMLRHDVVINAAELFHLRYGHHPACSATSDRRPHILLLSPGALLGQQRKSFQPDHSLRAAPCSLAGQFRATALILENIFDIDQEASGCPEQRYNTDRQDRVSAEAEKVYLALRPSGPAPLQLPRTSPARSHCAAPHRFCSPSSPSGPQGFTIYLAIGCQRQRLQQHEYRGVSL